MGLPVDDLPCLDRDDNREMGVGHAWDHDNQREEGPVCIRQEAGQVVIHVYSHLVVLDIHQEDMEVLFCNRLVGIPPNYACNLEGGVRVRSHQEVYSRWGDHQQGEA